jgi:hypothetical protein
VGVVADIRPDDDLRVDPQHVQQQGRLESPPVVLADGQAAAAGQELVEQHLVLDQPLGAGRPAQRPGHLPGDAQGRVALRQRLLRLRAQQGDHPCRVEDSPAQVGLLASQDGELSPDHIRLRVQAVVPQIAQDRPGGAGVHDVEDLLAAFQPPAQVGGQSGPVLFLGLVEAAEVIAGLEIGDGARGVRSMRVVRGARGARRSRRAVGRGRRRLGRASFGGSGRLRLGRSSRPFPLSGGTALTRLLGGHTAPPGGFGGVSSARRRTHAPAPGTPMTPLLHL